MKKEKMMHADTETLCAIMEDYQNILFNRKEISGVAMTSNIFFFNFDGAIVLSKEESFKII